MTRYRILWLAAALFPVHALAAQARAEPPAGAGAARESEATLARLLEDGFLVAADDNSFFGEVLRARVGDCTVSVFKSDGAETEEVRVDLRRVEAPTLASIHIGLDRNASAAWVEATSEPPTGPGAPPSILRLLWSSAELASGSGKPQDAAGAATVRFVAWGEAEETRAKAQRLHAAMREVASRCR
jgi:hypothetical protein